MLPVINILKFQPTKGEGFLLLLTIHFCITSLFSQQDGILDAMFKNGGTVTTPVGMANAQSTAMAVQADGKIL